METISASDAKREFGEMILKAQKGPVGINKNGKPVAVMVSASDFEDFQAMQRESLQRAIDDGIADIKAGHVVDGAEVFSNLRKQLLDAKI
jgi:prevent-host-death family protein